MPFYDPSHIEYTIESTYVEVVMENGQKFPAFWAHPQLAGRYPAITLVHDWWGLTSIVRRLANLFAQTGYYVIVPDLFDGRRAANAREAMALIQQLGDKEARRRVHAALDVIERHHYSNCDTAAVGMGMGGSLAFEAAISRMDVEAAVAYAGFPRAYMGKFGQCSTPILALFGGEDPHIDPELVEQMQRELAQSPCAELHKVEVIDGMGHEFFNDNVPHSKRVLTRLAFRQSLAFLDSHLQSPSRTSREQTG